MGRFVRKQSPRLSWAMVLLIFGLVLTLPVVVASVPPVVDYPNHLARAFVLANLATDVGLRDMFQVKWAIIPNLATDILLPPLLWMLSPETAGRLIMLICIGLPVTGAAYLHWALFRQASLWPFLSGFVAYNLLLLMGFLNFSIGIGLALWGAGFWLHAAHRPMWRLTGGAIFSAATFVCHLFGFAFFALLVGSAELCAIISHVRAGRWSAVANHSARTIVALSPGLLLYALSEFAANTGPQFWQSPGRKLWLLLVPVLGYSDILSVIIAATLVGLVLYLAYRGKLRVHEMGWVAGPILVVAYFLMPYASKGGFAIDVRVPVMLCLTLVATSQPRALTRREQTVSLLLLSILFGARQLLISENWRAAQTDIASVRRILQHVPLGGSILTLQGVAPNQPEQRLPAKGFPASYIHYGAFAMIDRKAFWSDGFAIPGQQPIRMLPPYAEMGDGGTSPPLSVTQISGAVDNGKPSYLRGWENKFGNVLILDPSRSALPPYLDQRLRLVKADGIAALYSIAPQN